MFLRQLGLQIMGKTTEAVVLLIVPLKEEVALLDNGE
jgi:hypothetical protein